jgi:tripartite-type tricarboxylate transporter receptor subunit TctC
MTRWSRGAAALVAALIAGLGAQARADDYPSKPITLVVPFAPGGSTTIMARIVAERMAATLGQQVIVDNRGGAGGTIGARQVAKSAPDGYTILLGYSGTLAISPSVYRDPGFDVRKDFIAIGRIGMAPSVLVVHPSFPAQSIAELVAIAKEKPGKIDFASAGVGTVGHVSAELFAHRAGIRLNHIPYKGTGPGLNDVLGGHVPIMVAPVPTVLGNVQGGKLRALGITGAKRSPKLPDVPTIAESGLPGFEAALRYGLVAPAGTPAAVIERLNKELRAALGSDEVLKRIDHEGAEPMPSTPEEYAADLDREETMWSQIVKASGAKAE